MVEQAVGLGEFYGLEEMIHGRRREEGDDGILSPRGGWIARRKQSIDKYNMN
jgi:hypothetical protein